MSLGATHQQSPEGELPPADEIAATLREVLASADFVTIEPPLQQRLIEWIGGLFQRVWDWMRYFVGEGGLAAELVVIVTAVAASVFMVLLARRYGAGLLGREGEDEHPEIASAPLTANQWLRVADRRAGRGEFRPAASALYRGFLLSLEQRGVFEYHGSKTPGDYARELVRGEAGLKRRASGVNRTDYAAGAVGPSAAGNRFLNLFQDFSFGQGMPTPAKYTELVRMAREAGCSAQEQRSGPQPEAELT